MDGEQIKCDSYGQADLGQRPHSSPSGVRSRWLLGGHGRGSAWPAARRSPVPLTAPDTSGMIGRARRGQNWSGTGPAARELPCTAGRRLIRSSGGQCSSWLDGRMAAMLGPVMAVRWVAVYRAARRAARARHLARGAVVGPPERNFPMPVAPCTAPSPSPRSCSCSSPHPVSAGADRAGQPQEKAR